MSKKKQQYSSKFKAKVALTALKSDKTLSELAKDYGVSPKQISKWKIHLLSNAELLFDSGVSKQPVTDPELVSKLYQQIGEQKVQLDWLKKKSGFCD